MAKVVAFDLDGVLSEDVDTDHDDLSGTYIYRRPRASARETMKKALASGCTIVIYTGRGENHRRLTEDWLAANGFHYHYLFMCKPYYSRFVDDRIPGISVEDQLRALSEWIDDVE